MNWIKSILIIHKRSFGNGNFCFRLLSAVNQDIQVKMHRYPQHHIQYQNKGDTAMRQQQQIQQP